MPFHHTRVNLFVAQQAQYALKTGFAMHGSHFDAINPAAFVAFFDLTIGQPLPPTNQRTTTSALCRVATTKYLQQGRLVTRKGIAENAWQLSLTQTAFAVLNQSQRLIIGAFAHH
jgi:hypothetical protein